MTSVQGNLYYDTFSSPQKQPDDIEKPFLYLAEQFYQLYEDRMEAFKTLT